MFFWRSDCCYHCERYHTWRSFRRGMAAMFILAFAVLGLLDYPHGHHLHRAVTQHSHNRAVTASHRDQRGVGSPGPSAA